VTDSRSAADAAADSRVGLCARCRHARIVTSSHGATFYLCGLSAIDPRFPKYPALPVRACDGYAPANESARKE
jgi:hypothetical protein